MEKSFKILFVIAIILEILLIGYLAHRYLINPIYKLSLSNIYVKLACCTVVILFAFKLLYKNDDRKDRSV